MNLKNIIMWAFFCLLISEVCLGQTNVKIKTVQNSSTTISQNTRSSPAYAEVILRKTEREAELEELLLDYTEEFPKVKELKFEFDLLHKEMNKVLAVSAAETGKLTLALGKLMVRKVEMEVELWNLKRQYNDEQPEVKRTKRKIEIFDKAIKEILS